MTSPSLQVWLDKIAAIKPESQIELGLARIQQSAEELGLSTPKPKVILIGGTNGKGSTIAVLESLLLTHDKMVGTYTSPHLVSFNERICINGVNSSDAEIITSFQAISDTAKQYQLSYFEWITLAALHIFQQHPLDYLLLEVGLGGRLDATNIIDADVAIISNIDIDHTDCLGDTREEIAYEKAGIFRKKQHIFCGDPNPPQNLINRAMSLTDNLKCINQDYGLVAQQGGFSFKLKEKQHVTIDEASLKVHPNNLATALACFFDLNITCTTDSINQACQLLHLNGRCQKIDNKPSIWLDVAHNYQSITNLSEQLNELKAKCHIVFSMLKDKNAQAAIDLLKPYVETWYVSPVQSDRSLSQHALDELFSASEIQNVIYFDSIAMAYQHAKKMAAPSDTILVNGSFLTVGEVMALENWQGI